MNGLRNLLERYMFLWFPTWICLGRFVPVAGTLLTLCMIVILVSEQFLKRKTFAKYIAIIFLFVASSCMYTSVESHNAHIKVMIIAFLALDARYSNLYDRVIFNIEENKKIIYFQLIAILFLNIIFIFLNAGYSIQYEAQWSVRAYQGIFSDPHQCAYHICALLVFLLWVAGDEINAGHILCMLGYEVCVLSTGARVPTVLALFIGGVFCLQYLKNKVKNDLFNTMLKYLAIAIGIIIALFLIMKYTTFGNKMINAIVKNNLDSGRSNMRTADIQYFMESNWYYKIFGHGTDAVIDFHGSRPYGAYIWSHNDFTQILCGMGLIMFLFYCITWIDTLKETLKTSIGSALMVVLVMAVAFGNGLYIHSRFVFVFPLLLLYMEKNARESKLNKT